MVPWVSPGRFGARLFATLAAISVLPVLIALALTHANARATLEQQIDQRLRGDVEGVVKDLRSYLGERRRVAGSLVSGLGSELRTRLARTQDRSLSQAERQAESRALDTLLGRFRDQAAPETAWYLLDRANRAVGSSELDTDEPPRLVTELPAARGEDTMVPARITTAKLSGLFAAVVPVYRDEPRAGVPHGELLGSVVLVLPRSTTLDRITEHASASHVYLVDNHSRLLADSRSGSKSAVGDKSRTLGARFAARGREGRRDYLDRDGKQVVGQFRWLEKLHVGVVVEVPATRAYAPLSRLSLAMAIVGATLVGLLLGIAFLASRWLSGPLSRLLHSARALTEDPGGRGQWHIKSKGKDEVGLLANEINRLSQALVENRSVLEQEVVTRTQALHQSERFASLLFRALPEAILVFDESLTITRANAAAQQLFGRKLVGRPCDGVICGACPSEACLVRRTLASGESHSLEMTSPHPAVGKLFHITTFPVRDEAGRIRAVLESGIDITERRMLERQVVHQEKMAALGVLAAGVAHEIGNPLAAISALVQTVQRRLQHAGPDVAGRLATVNQELGRISKVLHEMTQVAKPGNPSGPPRPVDLNDLVRRAVSLTRFYPKARGVALCVDLDHDLPPLHAPDDRLLQLLINLLLNALDAVAGVNDCRPPKIEVMTLLAEDGQAEIQVTDNGAGMTPEVRARIFEPFFTTKEPGRGTGLGLTVADSIVRSLGGRIEVSSATDVGTKFTARVPIARHRHARSFHEPDRALEVGAATVTSVSAISAVVSDRV